MPGTGPIPLKELPFAARFCGAERQRQCALHIHFRLPEMDMLSTTILRKYVTHTYVLTYFKFVGRFAAIAYLFKYFKYAER